jgi:hypothetical protein
VNTDRAGTVPLIEAFWDIVPKEHLIGKVSQPLCCKTTFTSIMSRPSVGIDRGMKLDASSEPTTLLMRTVFEELKQTRTLFTDGSKSADRLFGRFPVFEYHEGKGWGYRTSQIISMYILETTVNNEESPDQSTTVLDRLVI